MAETILLMFMFILVLFGNLGADRVADMLLLE